MVAKVDTRSDIGFVGLSLPIFGTYVRHKVADERSLGQGHDCFRGDKGRWVHKIVRANKRSRPQRRGAQDIYLGWSQEVWIAVLDRPGAEPQIQLLEHEFRTRKQAIRTIVLSRSEVDGFLANFDRAALGIRVAEFGYDGREIAFERRLPDRTISYEGNASFSRQDASMAGIVDQLIATHGGYKFLQPSKFGRNF